ncbi:hypothetical protein CNY89_00165 [Amaricoccus sp. HAR-UPW-R2A-40]|nr:hypothetical protein CNY89_00165 [Amaricoccus sp. HAR-UPW-R2A-40]
MRSDIEEVDVIFQTMTDRAVCVRGDEDGEDIWLPLSQVEIEDMEGRELRRGRPAILSGPEWLLTDKGLL